MMRSAALAFAFVALSGTCVLAQDIKSLGTYESWSAWSSYDGKKKICYIYAEALTKKPAKLDHGRVSFAVRRRSGGGIHTEASLRTGYKLAPEAIRASVDGTPFVMLPRGQFAWLRREEREGEFMNALRKGKLLTIEAVSKRGNHTRYTFSLKGVTAAMRKASRACR